MSENYLGIMTRIISGNYDENYQWELSPSIKVSHGKVEIYRDTGVSKKKGNLKERAWEREFIREER